MALLLMKGSKLLLYYHKIVNLTTFFTIYDRGHIFRVVLTHRTIVKNVMCWRIWQCYNYEASVLSLFKKVNKCLRAAIIERCRKRNRLIYASLPSYKSPTISMDVDNDDNNDNSVNFPFEVQCRRTNRPIPVVRDINS